VFSAIPAILGIALRQLFPPFGIGRAGGRPIRREKPVRLRRVAVQAKLLTSAVTAIVLLLAVLVAAPACSADNSSGSGSSGRSSGGRAGNGGGAGGSIGGGVGAGGGSPGGSNAGGAGGSSFGGANGAGPGGASGAGNAGGASGGIGAGGATGASGASGAGNAGGAVGSGGAAGRDGGAGSGGAGGGLPDGAIGGYMTFGDWHGFAWTATGGMGNIMPPNFGTVTMPPLCASGELAAGNNNVAMVGININQASAANSPLMTVVPGLDGINISINNKATNQLRLQIQGPNGATDANQRWCAPIFGAGGFIPWTAFNTKCWDGTGTAYKKEPIVAVMILVPGAAAATVKFDFCLNNMAAATDPGGPSGGGCSLTGGTGEGTGSITGQFDWRGVTRSGKNYVVQNNVWGGSGSQALSYSGVSFTVTQQTGNNPTTGGPVSYPSVFIGSNNGRSTTGSNLPKQVSSLTTVPTGWSWSGNSGTFNAAYDVWFSTGAGGDSGNPSGGYLMVWYYKPGNAQPIGGPPAGVVSLAGGAWNIWIGTQLGKPIISYVRTETINSLSFDLNDFIKDAVTRGVLSNSMYLTNIFAGFEIWSGGVGLKTDNFCAVVN
jgi:hypothetical protein